MNGLMTIHVNRQEAEQQFSDLFSKVLEGEEIVIVVDGEEKARLVPSPQILTDKITAIPFQVLIKVALSFPMTFIAHYPKRYWQPLKVRA